MHSVYFTALTNLILVKSSSLVRANCELPSSAKCSAPPATTGPHGGTRTIPPLTVSHKLKLQNIIQWILTNLNSSNPNSY